MVFGRSKRRGEPTSSAPSAPAPPTRTLEQTTSRNVRESNREITRAQREMERERLRLTREEKTLQAEIKRLAKSGRNAEARMVAKNLVKNREYQSKMMTGKAQLGGVGGQIRSQAVTAKMGKIMGDVGGVMHKVNGSGNQQGLMKMAMMYEKESDKMAMGGEMMDGALESALGGEGVEEESDQVLASVLDELGLEFQSKVGDTPMQNPSQQQVAKEEADLMERIAQL